MPASLSPEMGRPATAGQHEALISVTDRQPHTGTGHRAATRVHHEDDRRPLKTNGQLAVANRRSRPSSPPTKRRSPKSKTAGSCSGKSWQTPASLDTPSRIYSNSLCDSYQVLGNYGLLTAMICAGSCFVGPFSTKSPIAAKTASRTSKHRFRSIS